MQTLSFLLLGALVAIPAAVFLNIQAPEDCSEPWRTKFIMVPFKLFAVICDYLEPYVGSDIHFTVGRTILELTYWARGMPTTHPSIKVEHLTFDGVPVMLYRPSVVTSSDQPAVVYIHGGGWVYGNVVGFDKQSHLIALGTDSIVISIEYRRAPEHPFPVPLDDCRKAIIHLLKNAKDYGIDQNRIAISGDSAGGNLAAAVAISLRDNDIRPRPALQVLIYPVLQAFDFNTPSYHLHQDHAVVRKHIMVSCWMWYLFGHLNYREYFLSNQHTSPEMKKKIYSQLMKRADLPPQNIPDDYRETPVTIGNQTIWEEVKDVVMNPLLSPLMAKDLSRLPKTYILTVEQDILRDEGFWFAKRLKNANVETHHQHFTTSFHGGVLLSDKLTDSQVILDDIIRYIKTNL